MRTLRPVWLLVAGALLLPAAPAFAGSKYLPKASPVPYQGFFATFPSGLRLVVYEMPHIDRFAVTVSYGAGAAQDPGGKEGLAHLAEHLAFRSRAPWGGARIFDALVASGFRFNATTSYDATDYYAVGKPGDLRVALAIEAARMRDPRPRRAPGQRPHAPRAGSTRSSPPATGCWSTPTWTSSRSTARAWRASSARRESPIGWPAGRSRWCAS